MKAWHFFGDKLRDGTLVPADGVKLEYNGPLGLCKSGLHFSLEPWDALQYAPGENLAYVEVADDSIMGDDKGVSPYRIILQRQNVRELLYDFACAEAWAVVKDKNPPAIVKQYLTSKGKERDAVRYAAWNAAENAAWNAARNAARDAAENAAWNAAENAAWNAARYAARNAAWDAAENAAWNAAENAAWDAAENAAWNAARYAARNAAWDAAENAAWNAAENAAWNAARYAAWNAKQEEQRKTFNRMVYDAFGLSN